MQERSFVKDEPRMRREPEYSTDTNLRLPILYYMTPLIWLQKEIILLATGCFAVESPQGSVEDMIKELAQSLPSYPSISRKSLWESWQLQRDSE